MSEETVESDGRVEEVYIFFLQEMQSKNDFTMPFRLLVYMTAIWMDFFKNTDKKRRKRKDYRLPPIIPLVLYNGADNWTAPLHFKDKVAHSNMFNGYVCDFEYILINVRNWSASKILSISVFLFLISPRSSLHTLMRRYSKSHTH